MAPAGVDQAVFAATSSTLLIVRRASGWGGDRLMGGSLANRVASGFSSHCGLVPIRESFAASRVQLGRRLSVDDRWAHVTKGIEAFRSADSPYCFSWGQAVLPNRIELSPVREGAEALPTQNEQFDQPRIPITANARFNPHRMPEATPSNLVARRNRILHLTSFSASSPTGIDRRHSKPIKEGKMPCAARWRNGHVGKAAGWGQPLCQTAFAASFGPRRIPPCKYTEPR
jgi:hypothetical protein